MAPHADEPSEVIGITDTASVTIPDPVTTKKPTQTVYNIPPTIRSSKPNTTNWSVNDILPHRQTCPGLPRGVAAFGSADMFKSPANLNKPLAKSWLSRLTPESAARKPSSLKGAMKYFNSEMISLCGGLPSPAYFPFESQSIKIPAVPNFSEEETTTSGVIVEGHKYDVRDRTSDYDLSIALNYGQSMGPPQLLRFMTEHTELVHSPKYKDWDICLTVGSTSALEISLRMFCQRGDYIITEEYSFSSAIETALPMGVRPVGIKMDESGLIPEDLDQVLSTWDEAERQGPKPFVLYTIPTGQNPTGYTQPLERRQAIYAICEKHDLLILEDEPYYFLQMEPYISGKIHEVASPFQATQPAEYLSSLIPSYLSLDTSGRVLRMDSFSKILAPGTRTGFVTAPAHIIERFIRHQEVSSQNPSGFSMMALWKLLEEQWGHEGFLAWLGYIRAEYTRRRDVIVNACEQYVDRRVARWVPPAAGMFFWIVVDGSKHPRLTGNQEIQDKAALADLLAEIEDKIFMAGVAKNVLVAKGSWFRAEKHDTSAGLSKSAEAKVELLQNGHANGNTDVTVAPEAKSTDLAFRMTFAAASEEQITEAVKRFGEALTVEFGLN